MEGRGEQEHLLRGWKGKPHEEKYYGKDRLDASLIYLIYFRVLIEAKSLGRIRGFRSKGVNEESIRDVQEN